MEGYVYLCYWKGYLETSLEKIFFDEEYAKEWVSSNPDYLYYEAWKVADFND
jgi:hypothetical protein